MLENNKRRVMPALEVTEISKESLSAIQLIAQKHDVMEQIKQNGQVLAGKNVTSEDNTRKASTTREQSRPIDGDGFFRAYVLVRIAAERRRRRAVRRRVNC